LKEPLPDVFAFWKHILDPQQKEKSVYRYAALRWIDNFFSITTLRSTIGIHLSICEVISIVTEILGGITNFLVTVYILSIHPSILASIGMNQEAVKFLSFFASFSLSSYSSYLPF
jgi:xanthine/uracil/vitamin C permease (AzgA family)